MSTSYPKPKNERERLMALRQLKVLDSPYETLFDEITKVASDICGTPIALISLIDDNRQWFKANTGLPGVYETPREDAFCSHTIMSDQLMEVKDATIDQRFANNKLVLNSPFIRYYAGAPITLPLGENIGSLCVIGEKAGALNSTQKTLLTGLAKVVAEALVARKMRLGDIS